MLAVPAGMHKSSAEDRGSDCTYVYARGRWSTPVLRLPAQKVLYAQHRFACLHACLQPWRRHLSVCISGSCTQWPPWTCVCRLYDTSKWLQPAAKSGYHARTCGGQACFACRGAQVDESQDLVPLPRVNASMLSWEGCHPMLCDPISRRACSCVPPAAQKVIAVRFCPLLFERAPPPPHDSAAGRGARPPTPGRAPTPPRPQLIGSSMATVGHRILKQA